MVRTATRGRPRDARVDDAVRGAVRELLVERGYDGTTVALVASRAGVGRGALYRRWRSKAEMVFAAAVHDVTLPQPPDAGSLEADLLSLCERIAALTESQVARAAFAGLVRERPDRTGLSATLSERLFAAERDYVAMILGRAVDRGEIGDGADPEVVRRLLVGPIAFIPTFSAAGPTSPQAVAKIVAGGLRASIPRQEHR